MRHTTKYPTQKEKDMTNFEQYEGKKVILTVSAEDGSAVELEGTAETANAIGFILKPKGKTKLDIIEAEKVLEVRLAPETPKTIGAKTLKPVRLGQARSHLLERHGYKLKDINAMTEQAAFDFHEGLDHKALDLGHVHAAATPAEEAVAEAESSED